MENQKKILQMGLELFAKRGFDAVGVQEIADAAEITKPTLYHYFGSKEGLLESILRKNFSPLFAELEKSAGYHHDVKNTLEAVVRTYFSFASRHLNFYRFQLSCRFSPPQSTAFNAIKQYGKKQQEIFENLFLQAAQDHGNMRGRHQRYAASFLGIINTYIGLKTSADMELDEPVVSNAVHQFMHGIFS
jgi:AcrR family transcriptional regulator